LIFDAMEAGVSQEPYTVKRLMKKFGVSEEYAKKIHDRAQEALANIRKE